MEDLEFNLIKGQIENYEARVEEAKKYLEQPNLPEKDRKILENVVIIFSEEANHLRNEIGLQKMERRKGWYIRVK